MKIYEINDILQSAAKFTKPNDMCYNAVFRTGDFDGVGDYGAGILSVNIHLAIPNSKYNGVCSISTVDDGVWTAECNEPLDENKALAIIKVFNEFQGRLPTEEILNSKLIEIGLFGTYTG